MLARNPPLPPKELGIPAETHAALLTTLEFLESGGADGHFNMGLWHAETGCGTVACIGGWCEYLTGVRVRAHRALFDLFYDTEAMHYVTNPELGALALRNYLWTGLVDWGAVIHDARQNGTPLCSS